LGSLAFTIGVNSPADGGNIVIPLDALVSDAPLHRSAPITSREELAGRSSGLLLPPLASPDCAHPPQRGFLTSTAFGFTQQHFVRHISADKHPQP
jgi:hypothetical protein